MVLENQSKLNFNLFFSLKTKSQHKVLMSNRWLALIMGRAPAVVNLLSSFQLLTNLG